MQLGMVGLGRMGANMARRLRRGGIGVTGYNRNRSTAEQLADECGLQATDSMRSLVDALRPPRTVWLMLPAGDVTAGHLKELTDLLAPGDLIVDGANSHFHDSMRRAVRCAGHGLAFVDAGVSGGIRGLENGYTLTLGGEVEAIDRLRPIVEVLTPAPDRGWLHTGPSGSGHFVKMVHNGIEYGMMQAYAEGFALLAAREDFALDLGAIAETWRHGSVIRSWLLDLTAEVLAEDATLTHIEPHAGESGEGRWTVIEAIERGVPVPVIASAVSARLASQGGGDFGLKLLAMMRRSFGGHTPRTRQHDP